MVKCHPAEPVERAHRHRKACGLAPLRQDPERYRHEVYPAPNIGKRKVQELRTYDIEKFYATLAKTPCGQHVHGVKQTLTDKQKKRLLSSTSIHEVHTLLKTAFSYAVEWDLIHKIPPAP